MYQITPAELVTLLTIAGAAFSFGSLLSKKQDKRICTLNNKEFMDVVNSLKIVVSELSNTLSEIRARQEVGFENLQRQIDHLQKQIDISNKLDQIQELVTHERK